MSVAHFDTSPIGMVASLWRNRQLIWQMTKREVIGRYRGSIMGLAWSLFNPILMLAVYTFVFSVVFQMRWNVGGDEGKLDFAIVLFVGMIIHGLFAECVNRAPGLILSNVNYVKKVVFPLEVIPWVALGSALFHSLVSLVVLLIALFIFKLYLHWTVIFLPLIVAPLVLATVGLAWFLAATGVFIRDIAHVTSIMTIALLFLSPVFYPVSALPEEYRSLFFLNPLTFIIEQSRAVLIWGKAPDWIDWLAYMSASMAIAWGGFWWFQRTRKGFADVV